MATAYLALGSNLGDRRSCLAGAREALDRLPGIRVIAGSALYETDPVGGPPGQGRYLNGVLEIDTDLAAETLLQCCLAIEDQFGRRRAEPGGPRTLDVDLLFFGAEVFREKRLMVPHPRLHERAFVLAPLCDVAPGLTHPVLGETIRELFHRLPPDPGVVRLCESW